VTSNVKLTANLDCSGFDVDSGPILEVVGPAKLNLKGFTVIGNGFTENEGTEDEETFGDTCIEVTGAGAKVWNGTVTQCVDGVVIAGTGSHKVFRIKSTDNEKTGFKVEESSNSNWLEKNEALRNIKENFLVEKDSNDNHLIKNKAEDGEDRGFYVRGSNNRLHKNKADRNRDDALRIKNGNKNEVIHNIFNGTDSGEGVQINSEDNIVCKNIIKQNARGMRIQDDGNVVKGNIIISNWKEGILIEEGSSNTISSNIILNNWQEGIRIDAGSSNTISGNIIKNNGFNESDPEDIRDGLKLENEANENTLTRNLVFKNSGNGINVEEGAERNTIEHNIAMRNGVDNTYFDALDGNTDCDENIWCENHFGAKSPEGCIDSEDCEVGDDDGFGYDDDEDDD
jgi:parallel beta-helix repeat protein